MELKILSTTRIYYFAEFYYWKWMKMRMVDELTPQPFSKSQVSAVICQLLPDFRIFVTCKNSTSQMTDNLSGLVHFHRFFATCGRVLFLQELFYEQTNRPDR